MIQFQDYERQNITDMKVYQKNWNAMHPNRTKTEFCKDCGRKIEYKAIRCKSCAKKGDANPRIIYLKRINQQIAHEG